MIRIEKKADLKVFNAISCINNTLDKKETREFFTVAYFDVDNHNLVATDGKKLVVYHLKDDLYNLFLEENTTLFRTKKAGASFLITPYEKPTFEYVPYQRVIPQNANFPITSTVSSHERVKKEKAQFIIQSIARICNACINSDFASSIDGEREYKLYANTNKSAIRLDSVDGDLIIVIMPLYFD